VIACHIEMPHTHKPIPAFTFQLPGITAFGWYSLCLEGLTYANITYLVWLITAVRWLPRHRKLPTEASAQQILELLELGQDFNWITQQ